MIRGMWLKFASFMNSNFSVARSVRNWPERTIPIREIVRARNKHRRDLQATVRDRRRTVDELMEIKRGDARINKETEEKSPRIKDKKVTLKRYFNE